MRSIRVHWSLWVALLLAVPVLGVLSSWTRLDADSLSVLTHQWDTVMGGYARTSALLALGVALGVAVVGGLSAAAVTLLDFPGRRTLEWALLLPLAMPAYVLAYVYTDALQFSGPIQPLLRAAFGLEGRLWPDVRSLPGAIVLFVLCLYPYVYLLTRAALGDTGVRLMEAARLLGAGGWRRVRTIALPLARPALAAGVALALMETLADYGVGSYFGLNTFTTGIYRAWLSMDDRQAAAQLASVLLLAVVALIALERWARRGLRVSSTRAGATQASSPPIRVRGWRGLAVLSACSLPVLLGFVAPVALLGRLMRQEALYGEFGLPWAMFQQWAANSLSLALVSSALAVAVALALGHALRRHPGRVLSGATGVVSLGYAVPGAVIAVGLLLPVSLLQTVWPADGAWARWSPTAVITGTVLGLVYAYLVRFTSVALQSVEAGYAHISPTLDESARLMGTRGWRLWSRVHAPLLWRPALAAALLVFVDVMKELPATLVLRPFDSDTLAVIAYQLARDERLGEAALPSLALVAVGLIPVIMLSRAMRKGPPRT
ncbi:MAG: iron ABC transporter permease [Rubrivivax sp.]|nr:MAG: iron ABC transporter permease [Rubrivivax sp.]